jgi:hypothetical protein
MTLCEALSVEHAFEIDVQHARPTLRGNLSRRLDDVDARVVHEDVHPPVPFHGEAHQRLAARRVGDVDERAARLTTHGADALCRCLRALAVDVTHHNASPLACQSLG